MNTEMTCYESFAEVTEDFYCSAVDVLKILVLHLHDYHARCFHSLRDALYDCFSTDTAPHFIRITHGSQMLFWKEQPLRIRL